MIDKTVDAPAALADISDGASVMVSGFGGAGIPTTLIRALEASGARGLTLIINSLRLIHAHAPRLFGEGRVKRAICSAARGREKEPSVYERAWLAGELEIEMVPQGTFSERIRAAGAGIPAFYTPTGVGTTLAEGREAREFDGRVYLLERALHADFALLHAHRADRWGNLAFRGTQANFGPAMATASRVTVVEAESIESTPLEPHRIDVSGIYVQRVIPAPAS